MKFFFTGLKFHGNASAPNFPSGLKIEKGSFKKKKKNLCFQVALRTTLSLLEEVIALPELSL